MLLNLDLNGKPISYRSEITGPDKAAWEEAHAVEIRRLITTGATPPILASTVPDGDPHLLVFANVEPDVDTTGNY